MFPVNRSKKEKISVTSITVSVFQDGEIFFFARRDNIKTQVLRDDNRIELVKLRN
jgi:hypothetical protein